MTPLFTAYDKATLPLDRAAPMVLPILSRLVFGGVLLGYFWASGLTKIGSGLLTPSSGAYAQIFPRVFEKLGYDASGFAFWQKLVVLGGTYAEFLLPLMIVVGLLTRMASLGMIGFIVVQSLTDILGHGADAATIGRWFDRASDALILDQRALWVMPLVVLVVLGGGPLSVDAGLRKVMRK
jgi:putative oxidoreductase